MHREQFGQVNDASQWTCSPPLYPRHVQSGGRQQASWLQPAHERPLCATSGHRTHTGSERSIASHGLKSKAVLHSAGSPVLLGAIPGAALLIERVYEVDRDSDLHAQKRVAFAKETAKHRRALANIASNRNGDKIAPSDAAVGRVEGYPASPRYKNLCPSCLLYTSDAADE